MRARASGSAADRRASDPSSVNTCSVNTVYGLMFMVYGLWLMVYGL